MRLALVARSASAREVVERLNSSDCRVVLEQLDLIRQPNGLRDHPEEVGASGLDQALERLVSSTDEELPLAAWKAAAGPPLGEAWYRRVIVPFLAPGRPVEARSQAPSLLARHGGEWAVDPLLHAMTNHFTASGIEKPSPLWSLAGALGQIG